MEDINQYNRYNTETYISLFVCCFIFHFYDGSQQYDKRKKGSAMSSPRPPKGCWETFPIDGENRDKRTWRKQTNDLTFGNKELY